MQSHGLASVRRACLSSRKAFAAPFRLPSNRALVELDVDTRWPSTRHAREDCAPRLSVVSTRCRAAPIWRRRPGLAECRAIEPITSAPASALKSSARSGKTVVYSAVRCCVRRGHSWRREDAAVGNRTTAVPSHNYVVYASSATLALFGTGATRTLWELATWFTPRPGPHLGSNYRDGPPQRTLAASVAYALPPVPRDGDGPGQIRAHSAGALSSFLCLRRFRARGSPRVSARHTAGSSSVSGGGSRADPRSSSKPHERQPYSSGRMPPSRSLVLTSRC